MMGKVDRHCADLEPLLARFLTAGDQRPLRDYLVANSNLPGRRGNLELLTALGDAVAKAQPSSMARLWALSAELADVSPDEADVNDPASFLVYAGAVAIGAIGSVSAVYITRALLRLRVLARDPRWRVRESVAFGLQRLLQAESDATLTALETWGGDGDLLEMRAAAVAVAHPPLLRDATFALRALTLHRSILDQLAAIPKADRRTEPFRVLRKGLAFAISVVACGVPDAGFAYLEALAGVNDRDVTWIVRQNLRKKRLQRLDPDRAAAIGRRLET